MVAETLDRIRQREEQQAESLRSRNNFLVDPPLIQQQRNPYDFIQSPLNYSNQRDLWGPAFSSSRLAADAGT